VVERERERERERESEGENEFFGSKKEPRKKGSRSSPLSFLSPTLSAVSALAATRIQNFWSNDSRFSATSWESCRGL
jgi:hypothetical protein